jgi:tRNA (guanine-N7-)-methyltransferase
VVRRVFCWSSRKISNKNFIGIDIKELVFWRGAKTAIDEGLQNVAFIRTKSN